MDKRLQAALLTALLATGAARAAVNESSTEGLVGDTEFLRRANVQAMAEIRTAEAAQGRVQDSDVMQVAQQIAADHARSLQLSSTLAKNKHVEVPTALDATQQSRLDTLSNLTGAEFDKALLEALRSDQEAMIGLYRTESKSGSDPEVRQYAEQHLPILQSHLNRLQALQRR